MNNKNKMKSQESYNLPFYKFLTVGRSIYKKNTNKTLKIPILDDSSTNHFLQSLAASFKLQKIWPQFYNLEFTAIQNNLFNNKSDFYKFNQDFVIVFFYTQFSFNALFLYNYS